MTDYTLHYWPIPFRGQFIRAVLAHVGASWDERPVQEILALMETDPAEQPIPLMASPVLTDHGAGVALSQMGAILGYLGRKHGLIPADSGMAALTDKVVADANDVLYEMTRYNGAQMWTPADWAAYRPRLARWMTLFAEIGRRHDLGADGGTLLGTERPGLADLVTAILWRTMTDCLPALRPMLVETAPGLAALTDRVAALPEQVALRARSHETYGDTWCGGQIEASLRSVL